MKLAKTAVQIGRKRPDASATPVVATDVASSGLALAPTFPAWPLIGFVFRRARQIDGATALAGGAVEQSDRARRFERIVTLIGFAVKSR